MSTAKAKAPTNKVFHFPKGDTMQTSEPQQEAVKPAPRNKAASSAAKPAATPKKAAASKKPVAPKAAASKPVAKAPVKDAKETKDAKEAKPAKAAKTAAKPADTAAPAKVAKTDVSKKTAAGSKAAQDKKVKAPKVEKVEKVVRDSFTMPKSDYAKIAALKQKCLDEGVHVKKSELLRAGLLLLESASAKRLVAVIGELETVKTGRPANI